MTESQKFIDITLPMGDGVPVWPGDEGMRLERVKSIAGGDTSNNSRINTGLHFGTHLDAPLHFIREGTTIDRLPVDLFCGPCLVVGVETGDGQITAPALEALVPGGTRRLLLKTDNGDLVRDGRFHRDYVAVTPDAVELLLERGVELLGIDYLSIGPYGERNVETHRRFLGGRIRTALEGLDLSGVEPGEYELICLPLRITGAEASPVRAVLRMVD